ncbi:hypothetical protein [Bilophila wadsworthia]|uniref:hypothetical protein n=1 Tax=Bilophila wadsworthia TaxID=35833 RepID=UPI002672E235|nr:hypothetical protein [Bilophila wadsworthia]
MTAAHTPSPTPTASEAVRKLQNFPKEVVIEAFLSVCLFLRVDSVVSECKEIHRDRQFKMLMKRDEELSEQRYILANARPEGGIEDYYDWMKKMKKLVDEEDVIQKKIDRLLAR